MGVGQRYKQRQSERESDRVKIRSQQIHKLEVAGVEYSVSVIEIPFREGVELRCVVEGEEIRVSDLGLGEHEALRLLEEKIQSFLDFSQRCKSSESK